MRKVKHTQCHLCALLPSLPYSGLLKLIKAKGHMCDGRGSLEEERVLLDGLLWKRVEAGLLGNFSGYRKVKLLFCCR